MNAFLISCLSFFLFSISFSAMSESGREQFRLEFQNGNFTKALEILESTRFEKEGEKEYFQGITYARVNEFDKAKEKLKVSSKKKFDSNDLYYELGQVFYALEDYKNSRIAFKKSAQKKYKVAVSLYYIAYTSQELKDYKKAVSFYNLIEKLPRDEKEEILQAARVQVADIYLKQIERLPDSFSAVEKYVIPQYEKAIKWNKKSSLAEDVRIKIERLKRKYELELFRMRNGRPTARPPYFFKANVLYGNDSNVLSLSEDELASPYYTTGFFGRYSFYPNSSFSYAPELSANMTKYLSDKEEIYAENSYNITGALKMNYEHLYKKRPATFYIDLSYTYTADDTDQDKSFSEKDVETGITLSEEFQIWANNPTTFRYSYLQIVDVEAESSYNTNSFSYEQLISLSRTSIFTYLNYASNKYIEEESDTLDNDVLTLRTDLIFPTLWNLFNPNLYASMVNTSYINNSDKGITSNTTLGMSLNRPVGKKLYITLDVSQSTQTGKLDTDEFTKQIYTLNLDYVY